MRTNTFHIKVILLFLLCVVVLVPSMAKSEEFGGFGIVVAQLYDIESPDNMGDIIILHVFQGSEADKSGIRSGDIIVEVDGKRTAGRPFKDIILDSLRGKVGSCSDVKIKRVPENSTMLFKIKRALITYEPQKAG